MCQINEECIALVPSICTYFGIQKFVFGYPIKPQSAASLSKDFANSNV